MIDDEATQIDSIGIKRKKKVPWEREGYEVDWGEKTRPDTRLPKSRAGGQGLYLRSPDHLGRSREVKVIKS